MTTVKIKFRQSVVNEKKGSIYYQVIHNSSLAQITTPYKLFLNEWEELNQTGKLAGKDNENLKNIQRQLNNDIMAINSIIRQKEDNNERYSAIDVIKLFKEKHKKYSLMTFFDEEIYRLTKNKKLGTALNYIRTKKSLSNFLNGRDFLLFSCTEALIIEYELWLKNKRLARNTTSFYMRVIRSAYNKICIQEGLCPQNIFRKVYTGVDVTHKRAIPEEFIIKLLRLELPQNSSLNLTRDLFIFSFYTRGMSFIDMAFLQKTDIKKGVIQYVRRKTAKYMCILLESCMHEIIERYNNPTSQYIFPIINTTDEQDAYKQYQNALNIYNRHLKKLSKILDTPIPLSSYISRHTWATLARNRNIPISVISAGMGHNSEKTTQIYLASLEDSVIDKANRLIISSIDKL